MDWQIGYDDGAGTSIDVTYRSIMPPFDIHDPDMDPMKAKALKAAAEGGGKFAWGTAYNGHFDQTGHFKGSVRIRGKAYPIDCVSTMDHSWGPRPERGAPNMSWLHAHFSRDLAMHAIFSFDPEANGISLSLAHGYVVERGKIFGLKEAHGRRSAASVMPRPSTSSSSTAPTANGSLSAEGLTTFPWQCWPNMVSFNVLGRWRCGDLVGYGEIQDFFEMPQLTALNAAPATRAPGGGLSRCRRSPSSSILTARSCRRARHRGRSSRGPTRPLGSGSTPRSNISSCSRTTSSPVFGKALPRRSARPTRSRAIFLLSWTPITCPISSPEWSMLCGRSRGTVRSPSSLRIDRDYPASPDAGRRRPLLLACLRRRRGA